MSEIINHLWEKLTVFTQLEMEKIEKKSLCLFEKCAKEDGMGNSEQDTANTTLRGKM